MRGRPYIGGLTRSPVGGRQPPLSPLGGATGPLATVGWAHWLVARGVGDRALSPVGGATGPLFFFLQGLRCKFEEKKLHLSPVAPPKGDQGIFLKFSKTDIYF